MTTVSAAITVVVPTHTFSLHLMSWDRLEALTVAQVHLVSTLFSTLQSDPERQGLNCHLSGYPCVT